MANATPDPISPSPAKIIITGILQSVITDKRTIPAANMIKPITVPIAIRFVAISRAGFVTGSVAFGSEASLSGCKIFSFQRKDLPLAASFLTPRQTLIDLVQELPELSIASAMSLTDCLPGLFSLEVVSIGRRLSKTNVRSNVLIPDYVVTVTSHIPLESI